MGDATVVRVLNTGALPDDPRTGRVGMQNLRERLRLLYGEAATLELRAADSERVVAELRVPAAWPESSLTSTPAPDATVTAPIITP
jgi:LytS/YehU family sensor histidine kinase